MLLTHVWVDTILILMCCPAQSTVLLHILFVSFVSALLNIEESRMLLNPFQVTAKDIAARQTSWKLKLNLVLKSLQSLSEMKNFFLLDIHDLILTLFRFSPSLSDLLRMFTFFSLFFTSHVSRGLFSSDIRECARLNLIISTTSTWDDIEESVKKSLDFVSIWYDTYKQRLPHLMQFFPIIRIWSHLNEHRRAN